MSGEPIERSARAVRAPHDVRDDRFAHLATSDPEAWRRALHLDRVAALVEPLAGLVVTEHEHGVMEWLAGWDVPTVAVVVSLLHRARAAAPLDGGEVAR